MVGQQPLHAPGFGLRKPLEVSGHDPLADAETVYDVIDRAWVLAVLTF